jgi:release factor glutamine methyltransferase
MSTVATIAEAVQNAAATLVPHSESPRLDAELLLATQLGLPRSALIARGNETVALKDANAYAALIAQRADGMPVAYLTGNREFWSLPLRVSPAVLVPRPETEVLVERALDLLPRAAPCSVLDLGTGSGAIALSLAHERPHWAVTGVDISPAALEVAQQNARNLKLEHVKWRLGSWFEPVPAERFHLIIANPPYLAANDPALGALRAEPGVALVAGPNGLEAFGAIIAQAPGHMHASGWLALEHGIGQASEVARLLEQHGFASIRTYSDFSGRPRVTLGIHSQH